MPGEPTLELENFLSLPVEQVASMVRSAGPQVCVFPVNGTRRWFRLEHSGDPDHSLGNYVEVAARTYIRLFSMLYDHGIDTILSPAFGDELLSRGVAYTQATLENGLSVLEAPDFLEFYKQYHIRVRCYGSYKEILDKPTYVSQLELLERLQQFNQEKTTRRLFFGFFANDAAEQTGKLAIEYYLREKRPPSRSEIVEMYYGESVGPATIFIGFEKPAVFDYPLLGLGNESLYFMTAPSPYLSEIGLRKILYDHLFRRTIKDPDWETLPTKDLEALRRYYQEKREGAIGTGRLFHGVWIEQE